MPKPRASALRAILFTDVVGSTDLARDLGDERWSRLLAAERRLIRDELRVNDGMEVDTAGDGFFAVFDGTADAVRCAFDAIGKVQELGIDIRAGVHVGEVETAGKEVHGIVVHTGARVMSEAGAAELLITQTARDLVAGSRFTTEERGVFELKGVPGTWTLFRVTTVDDRERPVPVAPEEGAERRELATARGPRRRSWRWAGAVVAVALLVVAGVSYFLLRPAPTYVPAAGTVAKITADRFEEPVSVGSFPVALSEGEGRVWVMDRASQVYWVDEGDGSIGSLGTHGTPTGSAVGGGSVWITNGFGVGSGPDGEVSQLDPVSGLLTFAFDTPIGSQAIAYGAGAVWVADRNTGSLTRYDPVTRTELDPIDLPADQEQPAPDSIAFDEFGGETVWVGDAVSNSIYRVDLTEIDPIRTFDVRGRPSGIAVGETAIWVSSQEADAVHALDPSTGGMLTTIDTTGYGCNGPRAITTNGEGVWVACSLSRLVVMIEPTDMEVTTRLTVAGVPEALATADDGSVWVAVRPM